LGAANAGNAAIESAAIAVTVGRFLIIVLPVEWMVGALGPAAVHVV
jgi:hypothetical protein